MTDQRRFLPSAPTAISLAALFIALGTGAYAATHIDGSKLEKRSVPGNRLEKHAVGASETKPMVLRVVGEAGQPQFTNGWDYPGAAYEIPAFGKDENGVVHLTGLVHNASATGASIYTLPAGYRPALMVTEPVRIGFNGPDGSIIVHPDGTITPEQSTGDVHLDGVTFPAG